MTGVRQAIARCLVGMIASEFLLSSSGLGELIIRNTERFETGRVLGAVLTITLLATILMADRARDRELLRALEGGRMTAAAATLRPAPHADALARGRADGDPPRDGNRAAAALGGPRNLARALLRGAAERRDQGDPARSSRTTRRRAPRSQAASGSRVWYTLSAVFEGLAIGVSLGILVGLTMGRLRDADAALKLYVNAFFALPTIAVLPLMTLWFGYSGTARLAIVIFGSFMPVCLNVYDGVRRLPADYIEVSKTYHARWWNVWFGIALPASLPYLLARAAARLRPRARRRGRRRVPARAARASASTSSPPRAPSTRTRRWSACSC